MGHTRVYSYWEKSHFFEEIDFVIVGAGIVGLSTAIHLKKKYPHKKLVVLDSDNWSSGASVKNAGFACFGSATELLDDLNQMTKDETKNLIRLRWEGLQLLKTLVDTEEIEYRQCGGNEIFRSDQSNEIDSIENKLSLLNTLVEEAIDKPGCFSIVDQNCDFKAYRKMIVNQYEGSLNPVKMIEQLYIKSISLDIKFLWNTMLNDFEDDGNEVKLITDEGQEIRAQKLLLCTNAFTRKLVEEIDLQPARNQVLITEPINGLKLDGCFHYDKGYVYFRNYRNRVLLGGARNLDFEGEQTEEYGSNKSILDHLLNFLSETILPDIPFKIAHSWSGIIAVGKTKKPIIKKLSENVLIGVRMGGMGVAIGSLVGKQLSELVE